ncbi:MAG: tetratricopeptide repeat protein [Candidatus Obscuribacterales bacterium]|nr:tetratricopeptide repeat protein [Candidatus Obscuribacterales bacterium]
MRFKLPFGSVIASIACMIALSACGHDCAYYIQEGDGFKDKGNLVEAEKSYDSALKEANNKKNKSQMLTATLRLAELKRMENKRDEAIELFDKVAKLADGVPAEGALRKASSYNEIAKLKAMQNDNSGAIETLEESLAILEEAAKDQSIVAAEAHSHLGSLYADQKDFNKTDSHLRKSIAAYEANPGSDYGALSRAMYALAHNCRQTGNEDEANELDEKAKHVNVGGITAVTNGPISKLKQ